MIDKSLVKKRFSKSLKTYDDNAIVQKQMAEKLVSFLPKKDFKSVLEIGCATGLLTKQIASKISFSSFSANDIVDEAENYVKEIIPTAEFINGDIEEIKLDKKYDLIISNACLQWCTNIEETILKLKNSLNEGGILVISVFGKDNLKELNEIFDFSVKIVDIDKLPKNTLLVEETVNMFFDSPIDVLRHIKLTGANAIMEMKLTKSILKDFEEKYYEKFAQKNRVQLTYNPVYLIISC